MAGADASNRHPANADPVGHRRVIVAMLAHVAAHHYGFEFWGIRTGNRRDSMARLVYWGITGQKPPT